MASVLVYHVVGDLTVGKRELVEFNETETVESAIRKLGESGEGSISIWKTRSNVGAIESIEMRQQRFVGMLNSLDIVSFLAKTQCVDDQDKAFKTPVSEIVVPNNSLLRLVDPGTRLIDALDMMKQGVRRLLVRKTLVWKGASKRFSIVYNGRWMKNIETCGSGSGSGSNNVPANTNWGSSTSNPSGHDTFCCLSREDVLRFIIGCLGALAPLPLTSITVLGAITSDYSYIESSTPAIEATHQKHPQGPSAVAVVESTPKGEHKMIGEISACQLWKCDYVSAAWALANVSAGQFVMGVEDNVAPRAGPDRQLRVNSAGGDGGNNSNLVNGSGRPRKLSSTSIGFIGNPESPLHGANRSMYRGRSAPLTCKTTSSLAAVMAQMLSHRASHVWVTKDDAEDDQVLAGVLGYADIFAAVTKSPTPLPFVAANRSMDGL